MEGLFILAAVYFIPTIVAVTRSHHQKGAIIVINVFLGWSLIGWVIALAMACSAVKLSEEALEMRALTKKGMNFEAHSRQWKAEHRR
jgi:hypothetical protein